jgi:hypothetical protein
MKPEIRETKKEIRISVPGSTYFIPKTLKDWETYSKEVVKEMKKKAK